MTAFAEMKDSTISKLLEASREAELTLLLYSYEFPKRFRNGIGIYNIESTN